MTLDTFRSTILVIIVIVTVCSQTRYVDSFSVHFQKQHLCHTCPKTSIVTMMMATTTNEDINDDDDDDDDDEETSTNTNLIMVVGSANQDLTSHTNVLPVLGETVMGNYFSTACGGKGANQAVAAASLQLAPVAMLCRVGDDIFGQNLLSNFRKTGVIFDEETTIIQDQSIPTGVASIVVDGNTGDNMIIVSPGANYHLTAEDVQETITRTKPSQVVVQLEILPNVAYQAIKAGHDIGATTILNTAPAPENWTLEDVGQEFYPLVDILILNESELEKVCQGMDIDTEDDKKDNNVDDSDYIEEQRARALLDKGVRQAVIVTLGARGAMIVEKKEESENIDDDMIEVSFASAPDKLPCQSEPVVSTVGAGDAFCGALASYLSSPSTNSKSMSLNQAATYACGVASMTVRKEGAQSSYPTYDELPDCLKV